MWRRSHDDACITKEAEKQEAGAMYQVQLRSHSLPHHVV